jgi:iron complex outermembrane receptor protein
VTVAATRTRIRSSNLDANYAATVPNRTASVLLRQQLPADFAVSVGYYFVGPMRWLSGGDPLPASERFDLRLAHTFIWGGHRAELSAIAQNLTDRHYPDFFEYLIAKRLAWLQLRYEY